MIIQSLCDYYQRRADDPNSGIAPEGFEWKEIPFIVVIDKKGKFVTLEDTREGDGKKKRGRRILVPQGENRTVGIRANLLWDNIEYALGAMPSDSEREADPQRAKAFVKRIEKDLPARGSDVRVESLLTFLEMAPAKCIEANTPKDVWKEFIDSALNVTFRISGDPAGSLCESFREFCTPTALANAGSSVCMVTGKTGATSRLHPAIKGVRDAQSSGARLISFNARAFCSYGKEQNFNAPMSDSTAFMYTTGLNSLLAKDSPNKLQAGDATVAFWSARKSALEDHFAAFFNGPAKDSPDRDTLAVRLLYQSLHTGAALPDGDTRFFVLGLAPNAARLSVRFWHTGTVHEFSQRLRRHFDDLEIVRSPRDIGHYSLFWLLAAIATEGKVDNAPPNLSGEIVRSILEGRPYPTTLLQQAIRRIRAERGDVTRIRAAILKACLNRFHRTHFTQYKEITVALDLNNDDPGYRLGRLFAALEKIQEDALPGINATIRDRFYGAASSSPASVFPQLLKLKNHHLSKIENGGFRRKHEDRLGEIIGGLAPKMASHLTMSEQAQFAIGYYHQRQAFYTKSVPTESNLSS